MKVINLEQGTQEWLDWRGTGLGSTDIGAIMNMNAYKTSLDVFEEKLGISLKINEVNSAMQLGKDAEDFIREDFNKEFLTNHKPICVQSEENPFLIGSLDGYDEKENTVLEIKYSKYKKMSDCIKSEDAETVKELYPQYYCQCQYFLYLTNAKICYLATYDLEGRLVYMQLKRDEAFIEDMINKVCDFWNNHILTKTPPEDVKAGYIVLDDEEAKEIAEKLEAVEKTRKKNAKEDKILKELSDSLKKRLVEYSDDGDFKCGNIYMKRISKNKLNTERLYADYNIDEEILKKYTSKDIGYWTVSIS